MNWWSADGIPMLPVDDAGRANAYPLMRVQARNASGVLASLDVVLPVASEADCQLCHADPIDCADPRLPPELVSQDCSGAAISPTQFTGTEFTVATIDTSPGTTVAQQLLNAAKINILRLHDAKHGAAYTRRTAAPRPVTRTTRPIRTACRTRRRFSARSVTIRRRSTSRRSVPSTSPRSGRTRASRPATSPCRARCTSITASTRHCSRPCRRRWISSARRATRISPTRYCRRPATPAIRASARSACAASCSAPASCARTATAA